MVVLCRLSGGRTGGQGCCRLAAAQRPASYCFSVVGGLYSEIGLRNTRSKCAVYSRHKSRTKGSRPPPKHESLVKAMVECRVREDSVLVMGAMLMVDATSGIDADATDRCTVFHFKA